MKICESPSFEATMNQSLSSAKTALANSSKASRTGDVPRLYTSMQPKFKPHTVNLDYGCGTPITATAVDSFLSKLSVSNYHYDRNYFPDTSVMKDDFYDSVTASNLLNVVPDNVRFEIIHNIQDVLKVDGMFMASVGYVKDYVVDDNGKKVPSEVPAVMLKNDSYQANLPIDTYAKEISSVFGEDNVAIYRGPKIIVATKKSYN